MLFPSKTPQLSVCRGVCCGHTLVSIVLKERRTLTTPSDALCVAQPFLVSLTSKLTGLSKISKCSVRVYVQENRREWRGEVRRIFDHLGHCEFQREMECPKAGYGAFVQRTAKNVCAS